MKRILSVMALAGITIVSVCNGEEIIQNRIAPWCWLDELSSETNSIPAQISNAQVSGKLSADDMKNIALQVGRIPHIPKEIISINAVWDIRPTAALVYVYGYNIYCVKTRSEKWEISGLTPCMADYF